MPSLLSNFRKKRQQRKKDGDEDSPSRSPSRKASASSLKADDTLEQPAKDTSGAALVDATPPAANGAPSSVGSTSTGCAAADVSQSANYYVPKAQSVTPSAQGSPSLGGDQLHSPFNASPAPSAGAPNSKDARLSQNPQSQAPTALYNGQANSPHGGNLHESQTQQQTQQHQQGFPYQQPQGPPNPRMSHQLPQGARNFSGPRSPVLDQQAGFDPTRRSPNPDAGAPGFRTSSPFGTDRAGSPQVPLQAPNGRRVSQQRYPSGPPGQGMAGPKPYGQPQNVQTPPGFKAGHTASNLKQNPPSPAMASPFPLHQPLPANQYSSPAAPPVARSYSPGSQAFNDKIRERDRQFQARYMRIASPPQDAPKLNSHSYYNPATSETPWTRCEIRRACPSARFGHSANYIAARDGEVFIMGGIRDMDILDDLWVIDTNTMTGYQLKAEGAHVSARVGHAAVMLGNAHVVFGGDTKIEDSDPLDDNLYLLNTSSVKWTKVQPVGPRPCGRYGHSLSNIGAKIYVFGGQVNDVFFNDMWMFDLTTHRSRSAHWERIIPSTPPPPPRTNHTVVVYNDKFYLFGGANGDLWYSDTWCFDPITNAWTQLDCTGYVPAPCQGHASTIIGDVMYAFGGMSSQGNLVDQLYALKLTTLQWYTFQNLGPGPSPRSGHSLTAFDNNKILVWGGTDQYNAAYILDVSRINYPAENDTETEVVEEEQQQCVGDSTPTDKYTNERRGEVAFVQGQKESASDVNDESRDSTFGVTRGPAIQPIPAPAANRMSLGMAATTMSPSKDRKTMARSTPAARNSVHYGQRLSMRVPPHSELDSIQSPAESPQIPGDNEFSSMDDVSSFPAVDKLHQYRPHLPMDDEALNDRPASPFKSQTPSSRGVGDDTVDSDSSGKANSSDSAPTELSSHIYSGDPEGVTTMPPPFGLQNDSSTTTFEAPSSKNAVQLQEAVSQSSHEGEPKTNAVEYKDAHRSILSVDAPVSAVYESSRLATPEAAPNPPEEEAPVPVINAMKTSEHLRDFADLQKELAELRSRDWDGEKEFLQRKHAATQAELHNFREQHQAMEYKYVTLQSRHEELIEQVKTLSSTMEGHVNALSATGQALESAQAQSTKDADRIAQLEAEVNELRRSLLASQKDAETAEKESQMLQKQLEGARVEVRDVRAVADEKHQALVAHIDELVRGWNAFNSQTKDLTSSSASLEEVEHFKSLYESSRAAMSSVQKELQHAYDELAQVKKELRETLAQVASRYTDDEIKAFKEKFEEERKALLAAHEKESLELTSKVSELESHLAKLRLDHSSLEKDYTKALEYFKNQDRALDRTREELQKVREHSSKLEEQLQEARLTSDPDASQTSMGSINSRQAELRIRDLRAQVIIAEEERDELREQLLKMKKAALVGE